MIPVLLHVGPCLSETRCTVLRVHRTAERHIWDQVQANCARMTVKLSHWLTFAARVPSMSRQNLRAVLEAKVVDCRKPSTFDISVRTIEQFYKVQKQNIEHTCFYKQKNQPMALWRIVPDTCSCTDKFGNSDRGLQWVPQLLAMSSVRAFFSHCCPKISRDYFETFWNFQPCSTFFPEFASESKWNI